MINALLKRKMPPRVAFYLSNGIGGIVIASPLPDEIGVTMLAELTRINGKASAIIAFTLNTIGILVVLAVGTIV